MIKSKPCKDCQSVFHTAMYHKPRKPLKRTAIKQKTSNLHENVGIKKKPTKKKSKTLLKKKLEVLVKTYVKIRDEYTCQRCGKVVEGVNCHASHVIPVSRSGYLQFEPLNMKVLCYHDHINWWHKHPIEAGQWYTEKFPERWEYLQALHIQRLKPYNESELEEKIKEYREKTKLLIGG